MCFFCLAARAHPALYTLSLHDALPIYFEHLTISGQLGVLERTLQNEPVRLIGSSMGGYLAALYAARHPEVDRLVLLAPALDRKSTRLNSSHPSISYAVFCLKKKKDTGD